MKISLACLLQHGANIKTLKHITHRNLSDKKDVHAMANDLVGKGHYGTARLLAGQGAHLTLANQIRLYFAEHRPAIFTGTFTVIAAAGIYSIARFIQ